MWRTTLLLTSIIIGIALPDLEVKANPIPSGYRRIAASFGIPVTVFYSIALTESGIVFKDGSFHPWPWTLNIEGEARRYSTRQKAWTALTHHIKAGKKLIDIGLMQVNWKYHQPNLGSPWKALDPYHNLKVGANLLKQEFHETQSWWEAVGRYHSPGQSTNQRHRAEAYKKRVAHHLTFLTQKIR